MRAAFNMAWRAAFDDLNGNLMSAVTLAAVLAPLLVLYGLKTGIIDGLIADLERDPQLLSVGVGSNRAINEDAVTALRAEPAVGFALGAARSVAAEVEMSRAGSNGTSRIAWHPSASGDPLLVGLAALRPGEIALSAQAAQALGVEEGDRVRAYRDRPRPADTLIIDLTVAHVLSPSQMARRQALVPQDVLGDMAAFADGYAIPERGIEAGRPLSSRSAAYDRLRLYARSLADVPAVEALVSAMGFEAVSRAADIVWVERLRGTMTGIFAIIAAAAILSYSLTLWGVISASLRALQPDLALLRLLGVPHLSLWAFPFAQMLMIAVAGLTVAFAIAAACEFTINRSFLTESFADGICNIRPVHLAAAAALTVGLTGLTTAIRCLGLFRIEPSAALQKGVG